MRDGTVKEFLDTLEAMKKVYPYKDEETFMCTIDPRTFDCNNAISLRTVDEETGVTIHMSKPVNSSERY